MLCNNNVCYPVLHLILLKLISIALHPEDCLKNLVTLAFRFKVHMALFLLAVGELETMTPLAHWCMSNERKY